MATRLSRAIFSASRSGVLAYEAEATATQLVWFDRAGRRLGAMGSPGLYVNPALSPDGTRALVSRFDPSVDTSDIWLIDQVLGGRAVTSEPGSEDYPVWSRDGRKLIFASDRTGTMRMYEKSADVLAGGTEEVPVAGSQSAANPAWPMDWSATGRFVVFQGGSPGIPKRLLAIPTTGPNRDADFALPEAADQSGAAGGRTSAGVPRRTLGCLCRRPRSVTADLHQAVPQGRGPLAGLYSGRASSPNGVETAVSCFTSRRTAR